MNAGSNAQSWIDSSLYPFESRFIQLEAGNMHYIDEGIGEIILFVHGTPTWSFLYRDIVRKLAVNYRCIAIDHLGFGLSDKPETFSGKPQEHAKNLSEFIIKLNLQDVTLVVHDFGGPIGLATGISHHERVKRIVLMNTWLWATKDDPEAQKIDKIINNRIGKFLYLYMNFSPRVLLKKGFAHKKHLSKTAHRHYIKPFPDKNARKPLLNIAKALVGASDWYEMQWQQLYKLEDKPWLIMWGMQDAFITPKFLDKWKTRLPHAEIREYACGHFVQEEKTNESASEIYTFMKKKYL